MSKQQKSDDIDPRERLLQVFEGLKETPPFFTSGQRSGVIPGLFVGKKAVGIPIDEEGVQVIRKAATRSAYGRGTEAVVDLQVRRSWEVSPTQISFKNRRWRTFVEEILEEVRSTFRLKHPIEGKLHKLLLYEKGDFFVAHQDAEQNNGMFGTLVLYLPSPHTGGTLHVTHNGQTKSINFGQGKNLFSIQYAAFYTDCKHHVDPVESGYRVCLIYDLFQTQGRRRLRPPAHHNPGPIGAMLSALLTEQKLDKIAIPLSHQYTYARFTPGELKGLDRIRFELLGQATKKKRLALYLALMSCHQRLFGNKKDATTPSKEELQLENWKNSQGHPVSFPAVPLKKEEILSSRPLEDFAVEQEREPLPSNEAVGLEHWYHNAMLVVCPADFAVEVPASKQNQSQPPPTLPSNIAVLADLPDRNTAEAAIREQLLRWEPKRKPSSAESRTVPMLRVLQHLGSKSLLTQFLTSVLPDEHTGEEGPVLREICEELGWEALTRPITRFFATPSTISKFTNITAITAIFEALCFPQEQTESWRRECRSWAAALEQTLRRWDSEPHTTYPGMIKPDRVQLLCSFFRGLVALEEKERLEQFVAHVCSRPDLYQLESVLIPTVRTLRPYANPGEPGASAYIDLLEHTLALLDAKLEEHPRSRKLKAWEEELQYILFDDDL